MKNRKTAAIVLLVIAVISYFLKLLNIIYIPALTAITLAVAMLIVGVTMIQNGGSKKVPGILVLALGLFEILMGVLEIYRLIKGL